MAVLAKVDSYNGSSIQEVLLSKVFFATLFDLKDSFLA